ncbi:hypothetical protein LCGC14_1219030 [marine sediment metagenome]|uniref:Uncharacterized protein n=1 Tax=marine sediment metagenome TaxID=412755 RepID=A0A0F9LFX1_9ZZZZ
MARKRRRKERTLVGDVTDFTKAGVTLGVGAGIAATAQRGSGISVTPAFATAGSLLRPVGTGLLGFHALRGLERITKVKSKKRNTRR